MIRGRAGPGGCGGQWRGLATPRTLSSSLDPALLANACSHSRGRTGWIKSNSTSTDCAPQIQRRSMATRTTASFAARTITREDGGDIMRRFTLTLLSASLFGIAGVAVVG